MAVPAGVELVDLAGKVAVEAAELGLERVDFAERRRRQRQLLLLVAGELVVVLELLSEPAVAYSAFVVDLAVGPYYFQAVLEHLLAAVVAASRLAEQL